jgi:molybdopterin-guanine dinucleotide biosynthesis protein A
MLKYSVVIQAGGQSSRMGEDKGLIQFGPYRLVEYILEQVSGRGSKNFIVSNDPQRYMEFGLPVYEDIYPDIGALGGFHTVLSYLETDFAVVLACDMPFINFGLIDYLLSLAPEYDIVIPRLGQDGFAEPFRAVYAKKCLQAVEIAIQHNKRRVISFFESVHVRYVELEEIHRFDPDEKSFFNVNTPQDLQEAVRLAGL